MGVYVKNPHDQCLTAFQLIIDIIYPQNMCIEDELKNNPCELNYIYRHCWYNNLVSDYENIFSENTFTKNFAIIKVQCTPTVKTYINHNYKM